MNLKIIRSHCLSKPGTTEERPFGPETLVYKVLGKMFALTGDEPNPKSINLKCDPEDGLALRAQFEGVQPGYHMNKQHWNTVSFGQDVPDEVVMEMIDASYELVVAKLPKREREKLKTLHRD